MTGAVMPVYLFGYLEDDFFGRVVVASTDETIGRLAEQLRAWGWSPERRVPLEVSNERGDVLDPAAIIAASGLRNGDLFTVRERGVVSGSWVVAATIDDLWDGETLAVVVEGCEVLLVNIGGTVLVYEDRCPHLANPLSKGTVDGGVLTCAAHEWVFDIVAGTGVNPAGACLRRFPVRIDGDAILVDVRADE